MKNFILGTIAVYLLLVLTTTQDKYVPCKDRNDCKVYVKENMSK